VSRQFGSKWVALGHILVDLGSTRVALTRGRLEPIQPVDHLGECLLFARCLVLLVLPPPGEILFLDDVLRVEGVEDGLDQSPRGRYADVTQLECALLNGEEEP